MQSGTPFYPVPGPLCVPQADWRRRCPLDLLFDQKEVPKPGQSSWISRTQEEGPNIRDILWSGPRLCVCEQIYGLGDNLWLLTPQACEFYFSWFLDTRSTCLTYRNQFVFMWLLLFVSVWGESLLSVWNDVVDTELPTAGLGYLDSVNLATGQQLLWQQDRVQKFYQFCGTVLAAWAGFRTEVTRVI